MSKFGDVEHLALRDKQKNRCCVYVARKHQFAVTKKEYSGSVRILDDHGQYVGTSVPWCGIYCQELEYFVGHVNYIAQNGVGVVEGVCKNLNLMPY